MFRERKCWRWRRNTADARRQRGGCGGGCGCGGAEEAKNHGEEESLKDLKNAAEKKSLTISASYDLKSFYAAAETNAAKKMLQRNAARKCCKELLQRNAAMKMLQRNAARNIIILGINISY